MTKVKFRANYITLLSSFIS